MNFYDILSDIANFSLVIFGFCLALYTLIYSFIVTKKDALKEIANSIKEGNPIVLHSQKQKNHKNYITNMKIFNKRIIVCLWASLLVYIMSIIVKYFNLYDYHLTIFSIQICNYLFYLTLLFMIILFLIMILLTIKTIKQYKTDTKL